MDIQIRRLRSWRSYVSSFQHFVCSNCQRSLFLFHNDQVIQSTELFFLFSFAGISVCQVIKGFLWSYFSLPICIVWHMCLLYFPDPPLNPAHSFNAVDKRRGAGLCSGTSWRWNWCWKNTYPRSPTSNSFSGIDVKQHRGQIISSQGKLPIVHAMKQDETWNMLAHNEWCLSPSQSSPELPLIFSHSLSLELKWHHNPQKAITMTTAQFVPHQLVQARKAGKYMKRTE